MFILKIKILKGISFMEKLVSIRYRLVWKINKMRLIEYEMFVWSIVFYISISCIQIYDNDLVRWRFTMVVETMYVKIVRYYTIINVFFFFFTLPEDYDVKYNIIIRKIRESYTSLSISAKITSVLISVFSGC